MDKEDDLALRELAPDYQKNNQLIPFKKENGKVTYADISYLDPYSVIKKPAIAFGRVLGKEGLTPKAVLQGALAGVQQAVSPCK